MTMTDPSTRAALRRRLRAGEAMAGCSLDYPTVQLAFDLAPGFDILLIDCEHGGPGIETVPALVAAARACGRPALLRPWSRDLGLARRYLDCGVEGIVWPDLDSAAELDGVAASFRAAGHDDAVLVTLIETRGAAADLDAILARPRLDGVLVGPGDLAAAHGHDRRARHPDLDALHHSILTRARAAGVAAGGPVAALGAPLLADTGATLRMYAAAGVLAAGMAALAPRNRQG